MIRLLWLGALVGCGSQAAVLEDAAPFPHDGFPASFSLTSPSLADGERFPDANTCAGSDRSPELHWTGAPAATRSFAIVLINHSFPDLHWAIYDVPASATGLPAAVERAYAPANVPGAHQSTSYVATTFGYLGPCTQHHDAYELIVNALDVTDLPGLTTTPTVEQAIQAIDAHKLGFATLVGTSSP
jgi:phosphatidylethanolamine-binding protein (PEBP) family uncharacterized protein